MGIEIERKFLVAGEGWRDAAVRSVRMAQGYINDMAALREGRQNASVRVRIAGDAAFLNLKSRDPGHTRQEFDYPIPLTDARKLMKLAGHPVAKRRHWIDYQGFTWEVDEFLGDNVGLVVAEIELPAVDAPFSRPPWLGREVTDDQRYYNNHLAEHPYRSWGTGGAED